MKAASENAGHVLLIEDDRDFADSLTAILTEAGYEVTACADGAEAAKRVGDERFDVVMTDFRLPGTGGLDLVTRFREARPGRPVILMTAHANTDLAIEATKRGAFDFLLKPFDLEEVLATLEKAVRTARLTGRRVRMDSGGPAAKGEAGGESAFIGVSRPMREVFKEIGRLAPTDAGVLIVGETGTGKELVARALRQHSRRGGGPFVAVNCGALPEGLLESELFGHVRGAFTGAVTARVGRFEQANGGTLFLDEIGDMPPALQVKLLRVLQEGRIQPVGASREIAVDVRVIAATHRDLERMVREGSFREDLFYRVNAAVIRVPPLRERLEDVPALAGHFAARAAAEFEPGSVGAPVFPRAALEEFSRRPWPGNVRQLQSAVRRIVLRCAGHPVTLDAVRETLDEPAAMSVAGAAPGDGSLDEKIEALLGEAIARGNGRVLPDLVGEVERRLIAAALRRSGGHLGKVTEWLGISRVTLRKKMTDFGLSEN
ncbi:MAG: sigma-54-dependent Fis family transcriptional regulator [Akkermansiaceae bacterium]|nr:sigma-54-dependent Fis family transcriptional regulator [Akkermansiaceae bacterium]